MKEFQFQNSEISQILDNLDACIYISDMETDELLYVNEGMKKLFPSAINLGEFCFKATKIDKCERCSNCPKFELIKNPSKKIVWDEFNKRFNRHFKCTASAIKLNDGRFLHMHCAVDITDLVNATEETKRASQAKSEFLSRVSHEIRTPVNAIVGMSYIAKTLKDPVKIRECIEKIENSSKHLIALINTVLDMSKIEAEKFDLVSEEFNLEKLLMNIINIISVNMDAKKQQLHINLSPFLSSNYVGDSLRLSQVLTNLLSNAVKFSPEGSPIYLSIAGTSAGAGRTSLSFSVKDHGIGIAKEKIAHIFDAFEQIDGGIARQYGGTGLGLSISKKIVNLMGGNFSVESEIGKGSTFTFNVVLDKSSKDSKAHLDETINRENLRVMIIDDKQDSLNFFQSLMFEYKINCSCAISGEQAMSMMEIAKAEKKPFNIVYIDHNIKGMTSMEIARKIKTINGFNTVVLLISSNEWNFIEKTALEFGIFKFVAKPLFPSAIIDSINNILGNSTKIYETSKTVAPNFSSKRILLAEDVEINAEILNAMVKNTHAEVIHVPNGAEAVEKLKIDENFDLVLMDIHMPVMDGYEATRQIRRLDNKNKDITIIAMTANVFKEDVDKCRAAGMNGHIAKPLEEKTLIAKLNKFLMSDSGSGINEQAPVKQDNFMPYVDADSGLERIRGNKKLYVRLLKSYLMTVNLDKIKALMDENKLADASVEAHTLKGVSANLSIQRVYECSLALEKSLKADLKSENEFIELKTAVEMTIPVINKIIALWQEG